MDDTMTQTPRVTASVSWDSAVHAVTGAETGGRGKRADESVTER